MSTKQATQSFFVVILGVAFEHFDMMLASLLASIMIAEFVGDGSFKWLYAYLGYAIAFLFRPLGAFCFGCLGDLYGRKTALIGSMILMSTATLAIALIPGVQVLGGVSTLLFLLSRIAQGLAVGGEYGTAMTYAFEFNPRFRTFYGACVVASTHLGGLFASLLASLYVEHFRIPFLIGGLVGFLLLLCRSFMKEGRVVTAKKISEIATHSLKDKKAILEALIVASTLVLIFYGSLIYLNELLYQNLEVSRSQIFKSNAFLLGLWIVIPPCLGYLADQLAFSYHKMMRVGALGVCLSAPCLGLALVFASYPAVLAAQILLHLFHMIFCLCTPRFFGDLFAGQSRNTAISIYYSIGTSFTAALAPLICHTSITLFHTKFAICVPFILVAILVLKKSCVEKEDLCKRMMPLNSTTSK